MIKCNENGRGGKLVHAKKYWGHARSVQDTDQTQQQTGKKKAITQSVRDKSKAHKIP